MTFFKSIRFFLILFGFLSFSATLIFKPNLFASLSCLMICTASVFWEEYVRKTNNVEHSTGIYYLGIFFAFIPLLFFGLIPVCIDISYPNFTYAGGMNTFVSTLIMFFISSYILFNPGFDEGKSSTNTYGISVLIPMVVILMVSGITGFGLFIDLLDLFNTGSYFRYTEFLFKELFAFLSTLFYLVYWIYGTYFEGKLGGTKKQQKDKPESIE